MANSVLSLGESQVLLEAVQDQVLGAALQAFFSSQCDALHRDLVQAVRKPTRDTMAEAAIAGRIDAYENAFAELKYFAENELRGNTRPFGT